MTDQAVETTEQPSELDTLLQSIVNTSGEPKYTSPEEALKGAAHAQEHIQTLEQENQNLKTEKERMEDLIKNYGKPKDQAPATTEVQESDAAKADAVDLDSMYEEFRRRMSAENEATTQDQNKRKAIEGVAAVHGDKTEELLNTKAKELNVSKDFLLGVAANSVEAFNNLIGLKPKQASTSGFGTSSVNTEALQYNQHEDKLPNPLRTGRSKDAINLMKQIEEKLKLNRG
jgi:hypothetical protein